MDFIKCKDDIIRWIADFFKVNASHETKAVIGISGGKDSSVTAALCVQALGKTRVLGVLMPQGEQEDIDTAIDLCDTLGIEYTTINIGKTVHEIFCGLEASGIKPNTAALINTPARIRMTVLYAVSASVNGFVANTCNLSEDYVGYSTKFGDSAGDFSPLSDLTVGEVKAVGYALGLSMRFIEKTPLDGLSGKTDEEKLGFTYETLDRYIREGVCDDEQLKNKIDSLHAANLHKIKPMPKFIMNRNGS